MNTIKSKVLYLDDEKDNLEVFKFNFFKDHDIFLAQNVQEATSILNNEDIHVLITDYRMPEMSGAEFVASIMNDHPDPVRIVLTAHSDYDTIIDSINTARIFHFATKPWKKEELANVIKNADEYYRLKQSNNQLMQKLTDINRQLEQELNQTKNLVWTQNSEIEKFEQITSHHLKTPLRSIGTMVQWIINDNLSNMDVKTQEYMTILDSNLKKMYRLLDGLLDYIKVGIHTKSTHQSEISTLIPELKTRYEGITMSCSYDNGVIPIEGNHMRILLDEILKNAYETGANNIELNCLNPGNGYLELSVRNDGPPIESVHQPKIFDLFYTYSKQENHLGIGLAKVKKIVDLYQGNINIESTDKLTEFKIRFPI